jgi:hypothetical protein
MIVSSKSKDTHWQYTSNTNTIWSHYGTSSLDLTKSGKFPSSHIVLEVQELVEHLTEVTHVKRVRAIAPRYPDLHWIDFELELQPETELSDEVWYQVQDLVIDYEWKLRDDSGEKWYFHAQPVNKFSQLREPAQIVADSYRTQSTHPRIQTWSSPPLNLVMLSNL